MVQPLPIRKETPPDDAVVVIRAGVMEPRAVEDAASRCFEGYGILGISVEAAIGVSIVEACRTSGRLARYRQLRLSSFGRLRAAGFPLVATFDAPHYTLTPARSVGDHPGPARAGLRQADPQPRATGARVT